MADYGLFNDLVPSGSGAAPAVAAAEPPDFGLFNDLVPKQRGNIAEAGRALARGVVGGAGQAASGVSALLPESAPDLGVGRAGKAVTGYARERFAPSPGREGEFFANELPEAVGGMAPGAAAVIGGSVAGTPLTGLGVGAALFGAQGAGSAAEEAEAKGASPGQRQAAAAGGALSGAALSLIPGGTLTRLLRLPGTALPGILGYGMRTAAAGGEGASIGAIGRGIDNAIAQYTYDPDRTLSEGMAHAATLTGATAGLLHSLVGELGRRRPEAPAPEPEAPQPGQLALPPPAIPMGDGAPRAAEPPLAAPLALPAPRPLDATDRAAIARTTSDAGADALGPSTTPFVMRNQSDTLALVAKYESGNKPLIGWGNTDLSGYKLTDTGFPDWPGKPGPKGNSTAAGLYQITRSTWDPIARRLGITDFSPESQRAVAEELYRTRGMQPWAPHNPKLAAAIARGEVGELPARADAAAEGAPLALPAPPLALPKPDTTYGDNFLMSDSKPTEAQKLLPKPATTYGEGFVANAPQTGTPIERAMYAVSQLNPGDPVTRRLLAQLSGLRSADQIATMRDRMVKQGVVSSRDGRYYRAETANKPEVFSRQPQPIPEPPVPAIQEAPPPAPPPGPAVEARAPQPAPENPSTNPVPFQERPAPTAPPVARPLSFEQFTAERGTEPFVSEPGMHRTPGGLSGPAQRSALAGLARRNEENAQQRDALRSEYDARVESGEIRQPTRREELEARAQGHPDNPSVQASQRLLAKMDQRQAELKELPLAPAEPQPSAPKTPLEIALENRRQREISLGRDPDKFLPRDTEPQTAREQPSAKPLSPIQYALSQYRAERFPNMLIEHIAGDYWLSDKDGHLLAGRPFKSRGEAERARSAALDRAQRRYYADPSKPNEAPPEAAQQRPGGETTPRAALRDELYSLVRERAPTLRLRTLDELVGTIEGRASPIHGAYHTETRPGGLLEHIASVALGGPDPRAALSHEIVHFFRRSGMFTRPEWEILSGKADKWAEQFKIDERYKDQPIGVRREEAVAEAYAAWDRGDMQMPPGLRRIFGKVKDFFDRTGNWLRGRGFQNADDVFRAMDRGEVGGREPGAEIGGAAEIGVKAARPGASPTFYRGAKLGDDRRIRTGDQFWDSLLFASKNIDDAKMYGPNITAYTPKANAKILTEGSREFRQLARGIQKNLNLLDYSSEVARRAKAAGWDAVAFQRQGDVGTAILNPDAFTASAHLSDETKYQRPAAADRIEAALRQIRTAPDDRPLQERSLGFIKGALNRIRDEARYAAVDSFDPIAKLEKGANKGELRDAAVSAFKAAHLSRELPAMMSQVVGLPDGRGGFHGGVPMLKDGAYVTNPDSKPLSAVLKPIFDAGLQKPFELWMAVTRGKRLMAEGRENLISPEMIAEFKDLDQKHLGPNGENIFRDTQKEWIAFNKRLLDFAEQTGLVNKEQRGLWERGDYVPFFRNMGEESPIGPGKGPRGIANQNSGIKALKGGAEKLNSLYENMFTLSESLVSRSVKNEAARRTRDLAEPLAAMEKVSLSEKMAETGKRRGDNIVSLMDDGKQQYYRVTQPLLLKAISNFGPLQAEGITKWLGLPKKLLTMAVTHEPTFMAANLMRDTLHSWVVTGSDFKPGFDTMKGAIAALRNSPEAMALMAGGGGGHHFYESGAKGAKGFIRELGGGWSPLDPRRLWDKLGELGSASEMANRIAIYEAALKHGDSNAEAIWQSKDLLNFTASGGSQLMKFLVQTVPFMNARVQGLDRLQRGARENPASFLMRGGLITAASLGLWALNKDNPDYQRLPDYEKQAYWHLFLPGFSLRIPKPFEVGAIFGAVPEMLGDFADNGNWNQLWRAFVANGTQQLNLSPIPQAFSPALDVATNTNSLTKAPIVNEAEKHLVAGERFGPNTSATMKTLGQQIGVSPDQMEYLFKGYTGTLGGYLLSVTDQLTDAATGRVRPETRLDQYPIVSRFIRTEPTMANRWINGFYDIKTEADQLHATMGEMVKQGRAAEAQELVKDNLDMLGLRGSTQSIGAQLTAVRKAMKQIQDTPNLSGAEMRERLDQLTVIRNRLGESARQIVERARP